MTRQLIEPQAEWWRKATYESLTTLGTGTVKMASWLNGGAIALTVGFVGQQWASANSDLIASARIAMLCFSGGLVAAVIASVVSYMGQRWLFAEGTGTMTNGTWWNNYLLWLGGAVVCIFASIGGFIAGAWSIILGVT